MLFQDKVSPEFAARVQAMSTYLDVPADWLMAVMNFETAGTFSPSIRNPHSTAVGLIQFLESTANELGTTTAALGAMSALAQLDYVQEYYKRRIKQYGHFTCVCDCYLAVFYPKAIPQPLSFSFPRSVAQVNQVFDRNHDGDITKQEIQDTILSRIPAGYDLSELGDTTKKN